MTKGFRHIKEVKEKGEISGVPEMSSLRCHAIIKVSSFLATGMLYIFVSQIWEEDPVSLLECCSIDSCDVGSRWLISTTRLTIVTETSQKTIAANFHKLKQSTGLKVDCDSPTLYVCRGALAVSGPPHCTTNLA